jgi:hypothetical protein
LLSNPVGKKCSLTAVQTSFLKPWASAKKPPNTPCSSGNSPTKSERRSTLHMKDAISIFSFTN